MLHQKKKTGKCDWNRLKQWCCRQRKSRKFFKSS